MKKSIFLSTILFFALFMNANAQKHEFVEGKKFEVKFYEVKPTGLGKAIDGLISFKGGKVSADIIEEKFMYTPANYTIITDSVYMEDGEAVQLIVAEVVDNGEKGEVKGVLTLNDNDIEGTFVLMKGGVEKKKYEFEGRLKGK